MGVSYLEQDQSKLELLSAASGQYIQDLEHCDTEGQYA